MKAIVMSGGAGTRLQPLSLLRPKPMVSLLDKPLLYHILLLLRENGFTEICMTLQYLPKSIQDWFGDGAELGMNICYMVEDAPLGTAGSVRACAGFIGEEDVLVISGDAACSLDLRAFAAYHREQGTDATILVRSCSEPLEYGLVLTGEDGSVSRFIEKPDLSRVYTDLVNTGMYMLRPQVLDLIPAQGAYDFGSQLFPRLLQAGRKLQTWQGKGYWNDVGSCEAYRQTCFDVLDGQLPLNAAPSQAISCIPPCWISPQASVSPEARLGPYAVVGAGSTVAAGCRVARSVLDGASLDRDCQVSGSILCQGVRLGAGVQVLDGAVLADGVAVGQGSLIGPLVRLWPGKTVEAGVSVTRSVCSQQKPYRLSFDADGRLRGAAVSALTPEILLRLGAAKDGFRRCAAASGGGAYAALLTDAFLCSCAAAGREAYRMDAPLPATAAYASTQFGLDMSLFIQQSGNQLTLFFFDQDGLPISRKQQRSLEAALNAEAQLAQASSCSPIKTLSSVPEAHAAAAALHCGALDGLRLSVSGGELLRASLRLKHAVLTQPEAGVLSFRLSDDGFTLEATDEQGRIWTWDKLLCALTYCELSGGRRCLCLPYAAPEAADRLAASLGGRLYRLVSGSDDLEIWRKKPYARDGIFCALRLCSWLAAWEREQPGRGTLSQLMSRLPDYHYHERVFAHSGNGAAQLKELAKRYNAETVSGLRMKTGQGCITVSALDKGKLRILAESYSVEAASSLCAEIQEVLASTEDRHAAP